MKVLYDQENNRILIMPDYLVAVDEGVVHISSESSIWQERRNYILLGDL